MKLRTVLLSGAALFVLAAGPMPPLSAVAHASECDSSARIDGSTADDARTKIEKAGYRQVTGLKKGCDNFWHGTGMKDGTQSGVLVTPQGEVKPDGN
jgi:hypothetical protein